MTTKPAPAPVPADSTLTLKQQWIASLVLGLILLGVVVEIALLAHGKIEVQYNLNYVQTLGERGGPPDQPGRIWGPIAIRIHPESHRLAMVDDAYRKILVWNIEGNVHLQDITGTTLNNPKFSPHGLDFDAAGNLYSFDRNNSEITVLSPDYQLIGRWPLPESGVEMAVGPDGRVYVGDTTGNVNAYSSQGKKEQHYKVRLPGYMAADKKGNLYVVELKSQRVQVFAANGKKVRSWKLNFTPFVSPVIDVLDDQVYVSEPASKKICVFNSNGRLTGELFHEFPVSFGAAPDHRIYITGPSGIDLFSINKSK